jgi:hypothetical protein
MQRTLLVLACGLLLPATSRAEEWDLNLGRLCQIKTVSGATLDCGGGYSSTTTDPVASVAPDHAAFRSLMSELGVVFAPNILSPSDTRGYSGFNFAAEVGWTSINPKKNANGHRYWRAAESVSARAFETGNIRTPDAIARIDNELPAGFAPTVSVMARKGFWFPVPSFEVGLGFRHLLGSKMWAPVTTAKLSLHEGFHGWPIPSLAVRGTGARVMGTPGFNLTVAGLDFSIAKQVGIASTFNLTPYLGYQLLWIIADSEVLDATPGVDAIAETAAAAGGDPMQLTQCRTPDCNGNFTFATQANITRHRAFFGIKANFFIASLLLEYTFFASGAKSDQIAAQAGLPGLVIPDEAGAQHSISFSLALDY